MKLRYAILALIASLEIALAQPAEMILLRHAEKPPDESIVHLSWAAQHPAPPRSGSCAERTLLRMENGMAASE
jgi:hypothetical protein